MPPAPRHVEPLGPREYVDRWGVPYLVVWNGLKTDPPLLSSGCWRQSSGYTAPEPD